jgi:hypothetical protein
MLPLQGHQRSTCRSPDANARCPPITDARRHPPNLLGGVWREHAAGHCSTAVPPCAVGTHPALRPHQDPHLLAVIRRDRSIHREQASRSIGSTAGGSYSGSADRDSGAGGARRRTLATASLGGYGVPPLSRGVRPVVRSLPWSAADEWLAAPGCRRSLPSPPSRASASGRSRWRRAARRQVAERRSPRCCRSS